MGKLPEIISLKSFPSPEARNRLHKLFDTFTALFRKSLTYLSDIHVIPICFILNKPFKKLCH